MNAATFPTEPAPGPAGGSVRPGRAMGSTEWAWEEFITESDGERLSDQQFPSEEFLVAHPVSISKAIFTDLMPRTLFW